MKKLLLLIHVFIALSISAQDNQLLSEQKINDFECLFHQLEKAYPYFDVNKRVNNVDWLANYEEYRERIMSTTNDKEFYLQIDTIVGELNCGHADLLPTEYYSYFHSRYKIASLLMANYKPYVREMNKNQAKKKSKYWKQVIKELYPESKAGGELADECEEDNISFETFDHEGIAVVRIKTFLYEYIKADKEALIAFINTLHDYDNLIIDIQGNTGGDTRYWQKNIVPHLIDSTVEYSSYMAYRNNQEFRDFAGNAEGFSVDSVDLENLPEELYNGEYLLTKSDNEITPHKKTIAYKGQIYLLADANVYSSSEAFANFCKSSGFATVVGETTGGDGIGADPFLFTLPTSGIVIRYPGIMGLNANGSSNEEMGTTPHIFIAGDNAEERFENLLKYIQPSVSAQNIE